MTPASPDSAQLELAFKLLPLVSNKALVTSFLRGKGVHYSGSWDELISRRIRPALNSGSISWRELVSLFDEAEEFSRAHVFLYETSAERAASCIESLRRGAEATKVYNNPQLVDRPETPQLTEIRDEESGMLFKVTQTRQAKRLHSQTEADGFLTQRWEILKIRTVNGARLYRDGFLEVRIQAHSNTTHYAKDLDDMWAFLSPYLSRDWFQEFSLVTSKANLWKRRKELRDRIRFSDSKLRNSAGTVMTMATGPASANLSDDERASESVDLFLREGDVNYETSNLWWLPHGDVIKRDIHTLLSGTNEFAITADCSRSEYNYILNEIRLAARIDQEPDTCAA